MKRLLVVVAISLPMVFVLHGAHADRGVMPFKPHVKVFEPNQNAMIAWNGEEEILLLTTDLKASEKTKAIEVLPLPSEPQVKKGDREVFRRAINLINSKMRNAAVTWHPAKSKLGHASGASARQKPPAGEITFHDKIGAHDISVAHVLNNKGFMEWVQKYLKSAGADSPEIPEALQKVVDEYLEEGFTWFAFDVVGLSEDPGSTEAIQYRFKSKSLFYPLKISRIVKGDSKVKLLVLTRNNVLVTKEVSANWRRPHSPVHVEQSEARRIDDEMADLFSPGEEKFLRIWEFNGRLSSFTNDLRGEPLKYSTSDEVFEELIRSRNGTPLIQAAGQADLIQVRKLLDLGIGANWREFSPGRASTALQRIRPGTVVFSLPGPSDGGFTALQISVRNGCADIVKLLLDRGADVDLSSKNGGSLLMQAATNGRVEVVRVLVGNGANVNHNEDKGQTALHGAAERGYDEVVKLLLEKGADKAAKTSNGKTALQLAAERGHEGTAELLRTHGARE